jgi:hypothetical protein
MYLSELVLEVTRRCNMACEHCLRGDAQALDLDTRVIDKLFEQVTSISCVTFTGGEPSLNVKAIQYFVKKATSLKISIESFYVVTNGKKVSLPLMKTLIDLYSICGEKECCQLVVSRDQYHEYDGGAQETPMYEALRFYNKEDRRTPITNPLSEGRALENGLGAGEEAKHEGFEYDEEYESASGIVYISSNGNVLDNCNMAFDRIDTEAIGNILTEPLKDILSKGVPA